MGSCSRGRRRSSNRGRVPGAEAGRRRRAHRPCIQPASGLRTQGCRGGLSARGGASRCKVRPRVCRWPLVVPLSTDAAHAWLSLSNGTRGGLTFTGGASGRILRCWIEAASSLFRRRSFAAAVSSLVTVLGVKRPRLPLLISGREVLGRDVSAFISWEGRMVACEKETTDSGEKNYASWGATALPPQARRGTTRPTRRHSRAWPCSHRHVSPRPRRPRSWRGNGRGAACAWSGSSFPSRRHASSMPPAPGLPARLRTSHAPEAPCWRSAAGVKLLEGWDGLCRRVVYYCLPYSEETL